MPSDIHAILLVPHAGDPHKLLGDPKSTAWECGARPPMAYRVEDDPWAPGRLPGRYAREAQIRGWVMPVRALVLAWGGEVVWQGCEACRRAQPQQAREDIEDAVLRVLEAGTAEAIQWLRDVLAPLGTIVLLDPRGGRCPVLRAQIEGLEQTVKLLKRIRQEIEGD